LDADTPPQGGIFPRRITVGGTAADNRLSSKPFCSDFASASLGDLPERFGDWKIVY